MLAKSSGRSLGSSPGAGLSPIHVEDARVASNGGLFKERSQRGDDGFGGTRHDRRAGTMIPGVDALLARECGAPGRRHGPAFESAIGGGSDDLGAQADTIFLPQQASHFRKALFDELRVEQFSYHGAE